MPEGTRTSIALTLLAVLSLAGCESFGRGVTQAVLEGTGEPAEDTRACEVEGRPFVGIEPFLAPRVELRTGSGPRIWTDVWLASWLRRHGFDPSADWPESAVSRSGTASAGSDTSLRRLLRRAWEISPEDQIAMQAVVQQRVDGAVSKTVLLDPRSRPTPADVVAWIRLAHRLGCKGIAFFHPDASSVASASIDHCAARGAACPD